MKIKNLFLGLFAAGLILSSCVDDSLSTVGSTIQPDNDKIAEFRDTITIESSTVLIDSIYARTTSGSLGELYDPLYGNLKSDYISQFYCPENFKFKHTPINNKIDSIDFFIFYNGLRDWVGDSLAPMKAEVFLANKPLDKKYYTNIDPKDYCDMQNSLGKQTYTPRDLSVSDSLWSATTTSSVNPYYYSPRIRIKLQKEFGQKFYDETVNNPSSFKNQNTFNQFFPGLYITNTFGSGNIITDIESRIVIYYNYKNTDGKDTTGFEIFNVTNEVIQMNRFKNSNLEDILKPSNEYTYLKTPAGVFTEITIPTAKMAPSIKDRMINNFPLQLKAMPQEDWNFALKAPGSLLLLPKDSLKTFFEESMLYNNTTSFQAAYNSGVYNFGNIAKLIMHQLEKDPEKDLKLLVIPVTIETENDPNYGTIYPVNVTNYFYPSAVKLRKDKEATRIEMISTKYK